MRKKRANLGMGMGKIIALLVFLLFLTASCEVFAIPAVSSDELSESPWVTKEPMPTVGAYFKAGVVNDKMYLFKSNLTYEYDLYNWTTKTPMPTPRGSFALVTYQNKIYCIGGKTNSAPSSTNEVYDPSSNSWESKKLQCLLPNMTLMQMSLTEKSISAD